MPYDFSLRHASRKWKNRDSFYSSIYVLSYLYSLLVNMYLFIYLFIGILADITSLKLKTSIFCLYADGYYAWRRYINNHPHFLEHSDLASFTND